MLDSRWRSWVSKTQGLRSEGSLFLRALECGHGTEEQTPRPAGPAVASTVRTLVFKPKDIRQLVHQVEKLITQGTEVQRPLPV